MEEAARLADQGLIRKDTPVQDADERGWVPAADHPILGGRFAARAPRPPWDSAGDREPPPARAPLVAALALPMGVALAGALVHLFLFVSLGRLLSWLLVATVAMAAYTFACLWAIKPGAATSEKRIRFQAWWPPSAAAILALLLILGVPSLWRASTQRAYLDALGRLDAAVGRGKVEPRTYSQWRYGAYAPFLNLLHTMAFDYEKEVADLHAEEAAIVPPSLSGLGGELRQDYLVKLRETVGALAGHSERHSQFVTSHLALYGARFETLPYTPEVRESLVGAYTRFRSEIERLSGAYFGNTQDVAAHFDSLTGLLEHNPDGYLLQADWVPVRENPDSCEARVLGVFMAVRIEFTNPLLEDRFRSELHETDRLVKQEFLLQSSLNDFYNGEGHNAIRSMEQIVRQGLSR